MVHSGCFCRDRSRFINNELAREVVVGWYSTGPKIRENDIQINELIRKYCASPVFVICNVKPTELGLPVDSYVSVEEVEGTQTHMTFTNVASEIGAQEAEEVGVEHLLRDIKDTRIATVAGEVAGKAQSLQGLEGRIADIDKYLAAVTAGKLPVNQTVIAGLQDMFNLMPNLKEINLSRSMAEKTNDMLLSVYTSSIIRSVIALHNLINNKLDNKEHEAKIAAKLEADRKKEESVDGAPSNPPVVTAKEGL